MCRKFVECLQYNEDLLFTGAQDKCVISKENPSPIHPSSTDSNFFCLFHFIFNCITVWDIGSGKMLHKFVGSKASVYCLQVSFPALQHYLLKPTFPGPRLLASISLYIYILCTKVLNESISFSLTKINSFMAAQTKQ